jgi:hypothetical protein
MVGEAPRPGARFFTPRRQIIEAIHDTLNGQLDVERHGGAPGEPSSPASSSTCSPSPQPSGTTVG